MKTILRILLALTIWTNNAFAEGIWSVNGYQLSNVNVLDRGSQIEVSGRIQNGKAADYLKIQILVSNDNGYRCWAETSVQHYCGKGELFTARFRYHRKARIWNIEKIQVVGNQVSMRETNQTPRQIAQYTSQQNFPPVKTQKVFYETPRETKSYPKKENFSGSTSNVLFTSFRYIGIFVRNKETNKLVLMKSISPHNLEEIKMERGHYVAKIQGEGVVTEKEFEIKENSEVIDLD